MALQTAGFPLAAYPRSPNIPANVGSVDVKEIYDGVKRGLEMFETVRRAPASMALADATMAGQTAEAPLHARHVLAQTEGIEQQTPLKTAILASEASPEMLESKRQALVNKSVRQPSGDVQLAMALAAARLRLAEDPNDQDAAQLVVALEPMAMNKSAASARNPQGTIEAGLTKTAQTNASREAIAAEADATRNAVAEQTNRRVLKIAEDNEAMRRELDALKIAAQERIAEANRTIPRGSDRVRANYLADQEAVIRANARLNEAEGDEERALAQTAVEAAQRAFAASEAQFKRATVLPNAPDFSAMGTDLAGLGKATPAPTPTTGATPRTLTPEQVKTAAPGPFVGTNGQRYEKLTDGTIRKL